MRLLVVGRLSGQLAAAVKMAMAHGAKVGHVERCDQATEALRRGQGADLLLVDYDLDIGALIAANEAERIHVPVVACGVGADPDKAAGAIRAGAKEFIPLPPEADLIAAVLAAVADDERPLVSADPAMVAVIKLADQVARSEASILITGESGVGKEVIARALHGASDRGGKPFVAVNCGALPVNLVESILFARNQVNDVAGLNETILKTHQIFPLTTVAITAVEDEEYYMAFGALSSQSKAESIVIEVEQLFSNISGFLDAYESFLKPKVGASQ